MSACRVTFSPPLDQVVGWRIAMGTKQRRTNVRSRVAIVFEPSRLAADYLAEAYARVVPFVSRRTRPAAPSAISNLPWRARL